MTDFTLPELGENVTAGDVLRVLVKPGDTLARDQPVLELETDKATIEVPSSVAGQVKEVKVKAGDKEKPNQVCSGNIFAGAVKPGEKIFMFFSCVKKEHVPEGAVTIEAEIKTVGFADEAGQKNEFYWSNPDLVPAERPKGGIKAAAKKK